VSAVAGSVAGAVLLVIGALHVWWVRSPWPCAHCNPPMVVGFGCRDGRVARERFAHRALPPAAVQAPRRLGLDGASRAVRRFRELSALVPARYRDLDVRVYSPLCLTLAALIVVVIVSAN